MNDFILDSYDELGKLDVNKFLLSRKDLTIMV
jgi:hypothetical protein